MDNSQSSDCFPDSADTSFINTIPVVPMDTVTYESLASNIKQALCSTVTIELKKDNFSTHLDECCTCLNQCLDIITGLLTEPEVCINKLTEYLNDAVCILQLLPDFIKNVIECVSTTWCSINTFPITTGHIIYTVFSHCKESEDLYGKHLTVVQKQLKDLFRNCHELQLTYLLVLERHFIFNQTEKEDINILIEACEINLKIGEIVHSLDVKTMAEQWKAYTIICEKYNVSLLETSIFQDSNRVLCMLIRNNIKMAVENKQDDKIVMRSLKVTSFTIKILLKIYNIFKHTTRKDFANVLDVMYTLHSTSLSHLGLTAEKSQFKNLVNVSIVNPSECLLKELLSDETFCATLLGSDLDTIENDDTLLGFVLTMVSVMKLLTQGNKSKAVSKTGLINFVYDFLPHCHKLLNRDIVKLDSEQLETHGLFEHLLIHTAALAFTLNNEDFCILERKMVEAILGTDCCSALFSSNLWTLMARHVTPQLLFNQLVWLCTMYKKLENHKMFHRSPQKVHLSCTIGRLFEAMGDDDKVKICKQFRIHDDDNVALWSALRVDNLPDEVKVAAEEVVAEKLKAHFQWFIGKDTGGIDKLVQVINVAATCTFASTRGIEDCVIKAWSKTCQRHSFVINDLDKSTVWFYDYLEALVSLTNSIWHRLCEKNVYVNKVLHCISILIKQCNTEFKLILIDTLCKLVASDICDKELANTNLAEVFTCLLQESEGIVRNILFNSVNKYRPNKNLETIFYEIQENWSDVLDGQNNMEFKDVIYIHKCFKNGSKLEFNSLVSEPKKTLSSNFEFADMDELFEGDSDSEQPLCKKIKLDASEAEAIIKRLETDASLLCTVKENVFTAEYKKRVQNVCDKLKNIIY